MKNNNRDFFIGFRVSKEEKNAIERAKNELNSKTNLSDFLRLATFEFVNRTKESKIQNPIVEKIKQLLGEMNRVMKIEEKSKITDLIDRIKES